jgi:hypothetical protein
MGELQQAPTPFMIGTRVSRYQIVEKLGSGGMGLSIRRGPRNWAALSR